LKILDTADVAAAFERRIPADQRNLVDALRSFNVEVSVVARHLGPRTITYQVRPGPGVAISAVTRRMEDVGVQLGVASCGARTEGGKLLIEVEREDFKIPLFSELQATDDPLDLLVGVDGLGKPTTIRLDLMAGMICAGTSGGGKTNFLQVLLSGLSRQAGTTIVVCDCKGTTDLISTSWAAEDPKRHWAADPGSISHLIGMVAEALDLRTGRRTKAQVMPYVRALGDSRVVLVVDEVQVLGAASRMQLTRILEQGRQWNVHCVLATQDASAKNLGNSLRVNCPTRLVLKVASASDSRVALGEGGAENLLGKGDALLKYEGRTTRVQIPLHA
jgi:S-DNA-T family DNA segregation ATPase FtsK/SpoIIIE